SFSRDWSSDVCSSDLGRELAVLREPLLAGLVPEIGQLVDRGARGEPLHDRPTLGARRWVTVLHRLGHHRALGLLANLVQVDDLAVDGLLSLVDTGHVGDRKSTRLNSSH